MGLGLELSFVFDKQLPYDHEELKQTSFDQRDGLNLLMTGIDVYEAMEDVRILRQVEKALNFDLSVIDYWESELNNDFVPIEKLSSFLVAFEKAIILHPDFHKQIEYHTFDEVIAYLKNDLLGNIQSLIKRCEIYLANGAASVKLETKI